jgi:hypothetical protein
MENQRLLYQRRRLSQNAELVVGHEKVPITIAADNAA